MAAALYLKYRPQTLDDLIGQEVVKKTLSNAFLSDKLSHGYLLVGPRGTGKTSTARILAKMVNCEDKKNIPCNKCVSCLSITDGSNLDLIEIDAASNRGIDDIRDLKEKIKLAPSSKKKVYIIDEVHMLTTEAFNALLKTLEEPPDHVLFILATTDVTKIPATILSRVTRLDFKLATKKDLLETLKKIANSEKIYIDEKALDLLSKRADGSFRDGVKLLDQISSAKKKINLDDVSEGLRSTKFEDVILILQNLAEKKTSETLLVISRLNGLTDMKDLILSLMENLRNLLLIKNGLEVLIKEDLGSDRFELLNKLSSKFNISDLSLSLNSMQEALEKLKFSPIPTLPLELAVVEICNFDKEAVKANGVVQEVARGGAEREVSGVDRSEVVTSEDAPEKPERQDPERNVGASDDLRLDEPTADMLILKEKWGFVLETIRPFNFSLEALLKSVKILDCNNGTVLLEVPYSFHQRILETPKSRDLLESVLSDVLGKSAKVTTVLGTRPLRVEDVANVEIAADDEVLRAAAEIFNGKLVD